MSFIHKISGEHLDILKEAGELSAIPSYDDLVTTKFAEEATK